MHPDFPGVRPMSPADARAANAATITETEGRLDELRAQLRMADPESEDATRLEGLVRLNDELLSSLRAMYSDN